MSNETRYLYIGRDSNSVFVLRNPGVSRWVSGGGMDLQSNAAASGERVPATINLPLGWEALVGAVDGTYTGSTVRNGIVLIRIPFQYFPESRAYGGGIIPPDYDPSRVDIAYENGSVDRAFPVFNCDRWGAVISIDQYPYGGRIEAEGPWPDGGPFVIRVWSMKNGHTPGPADLVGEIRLFDQTAFLPEQEEYIANPYGGIKQPLGGSALLS